MYTNIPGLAADSYSWCSTSGQLAHCERSSDCDLQIQKTWISGVNHEFEEVPVGVAQVDARTCLPTASLPRNRTYLYLCPSTVQHNFQRLSRPFPYKAEVPAGRHSSRCSIRKSLILPVRWTVKVDLVVAEIDRKGVGAFDYVPPECPIESKHRLGVRHRKSDMIEASDAARLLSGGRAATTRHTNPRADCGHTPDKSASRRFTCHMRLSVLPRPGDVAHHIDKHRAVPWVSATQRYGFGLKMRQFGSDDRPPPKVGRN